MVNKGKAYKKLKNLNCRLLKMDKKIKIIGTEHSLYDELIDGNLSRQRMARYYVKPTKRALKSFIRLSNQLSGDSAPHGALLMLGFVSGSSSGYKEIDECFIYGIQKDTSQNLSLTDDFDKTLDTIIKRTLSEEDHDGAFLFSPDGILKHSGAEFAPNKKQVYQAHGFSTYYSFKDAAGIKGATRMSSAVIQSLLFVNSLIASISESGDPSKIVFAHNGRLVPINQYDVKQYYNNPPAQPYQCSQHP